MDDLTSLADAVRTGTQAVARRLAAAARADHPDFSPLESGILARLDVGEAATNVELARQEHVSAQAVSKALASLTARGLVEVSADPEDGRRRRLRLTDDGRSAAAGIHAAKNAWLQERLTALSPAERARLAAALPLLHRLT